MGKEKPPRSGEGDLGAGGDETGMDKTLREGLDFYIDDAGRYVFTADYLRRRGKCCGSGCRHCPYPKEKS